MHVEYINLQIYNSFYQFYFLYSSEREQGGTSFHLQKSKKETFKAEIHARDIGEISLTIFHVIIQGDQKLMCPLPGQIWDSRGETDHITLWYIKFKMATPNISTLNPLELLQLQFSQKWVFCGKERNLRDFAPPSFTFSTIVRQLDMTK